MKPPQPPPSLPRLWQKGSPLQQQQQGVTAGPLLLLAAAAFLSQARLLSRLLLHRRLTAVCLLHLPAMLAALPAWLCLSSPQPQRSLPTAQLVL